MVFVYAKRFSSVDLPSVSEEMKIVIAATACRLTMNMPGRDYGRLRHVIVRGGPFHPFGDPDNRTAIGTASAGGVTPSWPPVALRDKLPAVYDLLAGSYDQDPLRQKGPDE